LRSAIVNAKNAERVFFEDIPRALGFKGNDLSSEEKLELFALNLKDATSEISNALNNLFNKIEDIINSEIGDSNLNFPINKESLQKRFKKLKINELNPKQLVFHQRVVTALDDRKSWLSSVSIAIVNKTPDNFSDKDFDMFRSRYPAFIHELDNLTELSKNDINQEKEEVLKLEITSFVKGVQNKLVRLPRSKVKDLNELEKKIRPLLSASNKQENIALLIKLLQKEIDDGEQD
jgi:hypothetical protein